jgi:hypothetical protein
MAGKSNSSHVLWMNTQFSATFTTPGKNAICGGGGLSSNDGAAIENAATKSISRQPGSERSRILMPDDFIRS